MNFDRRTFLSNFTAASISSPLLPGILYTLAAQAQGNESGSKLAKITPQMIDHAAVLAGVGPFTAEQKQMMLDGLNIQRDEYAPIRAMNMPNSVQPAYVFCAPPPATSCIPANAGPCPKRTEEFVETAEAPPAPANIEDVAFATIPQLAALLRTRKVTSLALTQMYIARLRRYDPQLHFVITITEERAIAQAKKADEEIAAGHYRGPLHGIPWGAKDLIAAKGYPTTWGSGAFEHQMFDEDATVVQRLDAAGAVLIAKLSSGEMAGGDIWFGGETRNPWRPSQGSSGSSAGPGSATSAGCVGFSLGTETGGSISGPSTRCGDSGMRPSYGLAPRTGIMTLTWTMDKVGPICRSVEDCALVLEAIAGPDGQDTAGAPVSFNWDPNYDWKSLRVGYLKSEFDLPPLKLASAAPGETPEEAKKREATNESARAGHSQREYDLRYEQATLDKLRAMGVNLTPVELPEVPWHAMSNNILIAEAAAAFDDLTMTGRDKLLTAQTPMDYPTEFRVSRFYPAVEYIQANRARQVGLVQMRALFEKVDIIVCPSRGLQLSATNLCGNPGVFVQNGLRGPDAPPPLMRGDRDTGGGPGTPVGITFLGGLYQDAKVLAFARAYQQATDFEKLHPKL
jgi:Asp-tRNA(Asn)/Glu-tRNA(Gln) amidotransferase A subunit family amidase